MSHTLTAPCAHQEDIKKSRFAAFAAPVSTVDEAMRFFAANSDPGGHAQLLGLQDRPGIPF